MTMQLNPMQVPMQQPMQPMQQPMQPMQQPIHAMTLDQQMQHQMQQMQQMRQMQPLPGTQDFLLSSPCAKAPGFDQAKSPSKNFNEKITTAGIPLAKMFNKWKVNGIHFVTSNGSFKVQVGAHVYIYIYIYIYIETL